VDTVSAVEPMIYRVPHEEVRAILEKIPGYGLIGVDVENEASLMDDMLASEKDRIGYARKKVTENGADSAIFLVKDDTGILTINIGDVITIRIRIRGHRRFLNDLGLRREGNGTDKTGC